MTIDEALEAGWTHFRAERWTEAELIVRQVLQVQPDTMGAWHLAGEIALAAKNWQTAADCLGRARSLPNGENVAVLCALGRTLLGVKQWDRAKELFDAAQQLDAEHALPFACIGQWHYDQGDMAAAIDCLKVSVDRDAKQDLAYVRMGQAYQNQGLAAEAEACYIAASQINSRRPETYVAFGQLRRLQGRMTNARQALEHALFLRADYAEALNQLGLVHFLERNFSDADFCFSRAAALEPNEATTFNHLGMVAYSVGRRADAHRHYARALQIDPGATDVLNNLATLLIADGNVNGAIELYQRVLQQRESFPEAHNNLGLLYSQLGNHELARKHLELAIAQRPNYAEAYSHLGSVEQAAGNLTRALDCERKAVDLGPQSPDPHNNLGNVLLLLGDAITAQQQFAKVRELRPDMVTAHSNFLFTHLYQPENKLEQLAKLHAEFEQQHAAPLAGCWRPFDLSRDPERRLRVGLVSADLNRHPIGHLLTHMLSAVNGEQFEVVLYSHRLSRDSLTERILKQSSGYREVAGYDDQSLAEQIRADKVDILIDLSGHTAGNRLLVFARRPAPVQVTWMGYPCTTGLKAIDYLLADEYSIPPEHDRWFSERVVRLPAGIACHELPGDAPEVNDLPAKQPGRVTLASFNNPAKINAEVVKLWADILRRLPEAKLRLKYLGLNDSLAQERIRQMFEAHEIDLGRLEFRDRSSLREMLAEYHEVDLALDPFPYTGGTSTLLALQMGVPVVTLPGETFASRQSYSVLSQMGVTETIARDEADYVEIVVRLANDLPRLAEWRRTLRGRLMQSAYGDPQRFMSTLGPALRGMWKGWCEVQ